MAQYGLNGESPEGVLGDKWGMLKGPGSAIEGVEVEPCCSDATDVAGVGVDVCWTMHFCD